MSRFLKERISELRNITWPTKKQAIHTMIIVLTIMLLAGVFLTGLDRIIASSFSYLIGEPQVTVPEFNFEDLVEVQTSEGDTVTVETLPTEDTAIESQEEEPATQTTEQ